MKITKDTIQVYRLRHSNRSDIWADITLDGNAVSIRSCYGNWSYSWGNPGSDFKQFLIGLGFDYAANKFGENNFFDHEATIKHFVSEAKRLKSDHSIDKETYISVIKEIEKLKEHPDRGMFIHQCYESTKLFEMFDCQPDLCTCVSPMFTHFWKELWKPFVKQLQNEQ
jgi:hypothetical protein